MFEVNKQTGAGFYITFCNDVTVSVQFSAFNYCAHRFQGYVFPDPSNARPSKDAEVAVIHADRGWLVGWPHGPDEGGDTVAGYLSPVQVLDIMVWARNLTPGAIEAAAEAASKAFGQDGEEEE